MFEAFGMLDSTNYTNFCHRVVSGKSGCPECKKAVSRELGRKINKGLYSGREDYTDYLYVMMLNIDGEDCIKVGRSFHPDRRLNEIRNDIERQGYSFKCKSLNYHIVEHKRCVYLENKLHQLLKNERLNLNIRFSGMCEIFSDTLETFKILSSVVDGMATNKVQLETQP